MSRANRKPTSRRTPGATGDDPCPALEARDMLDDLEREDERLTEDLDDDTEEDDR